MSDTRKYCLKKGSDILDWVYVDFETDQIIYYDKDDNKRIERSMKGNQSGNRLVQYDLLAYLIKNPGKRIDEKTIVRKVWGKDKKIENIANYFGKLKTIAPMSVFLPRKDKKGYILDCSAEEIDRIPADAVQDESLKRYYADLIERSLEKYDFNFAKADLRDRSLNIGYLCDVYRSSPMHNRTDHTEKYEDILTPSGEPDGFRRILHGDSGLGKTTLTKVAVCSCVIPYLHDAGKLPRKLEDKYEAFEKRFRQFRSADYIPFFVRAKDYNKEAGKVNTLEELFFFGEDRDSSCRKLFAGAEEKALVIVDGLDEVEIDRLNDLYKMIDRFSRSHAKANMLLTSRFIGEPKMQTHFSAIDIEKWDRERIEQYLDDFQEDFGERVAQIRSSEQLMELCSNPFILSTLLFSDLHTDSLTDVLGVIADTVISRRWRERGLKEDLHSGNVFFGIGYVAFERQFRNHRSRGGGLMLDELKGGLNRSVGLDPRNDPDDKDLKQAMRCFSDTMSAKSGIINMQYVPDSASLCFTFQPELMEPFFAGLYLCVYLYSSDFPDYGETAFMRALHEVAPAPFTADQLSAFGFCISLLNDDFPIPGGAINDNTKVHQTCVLRYLIESACDPQLTAQQRELIAEALIRIDSGFFGGNSALGISYTSGTSDKTPTESKRELARFISGLDTENEYIKAYQKYIEENHILN